MKRIYLLIIRCTYEYAFTDPAKALSLLQKTCLKSGAEFSEEDFRAAEAILAKGEDFELMDIESWITVLPLDPPHAKPRKVPYFHELGFPD